MEENTTVVVTTHYIEEAKQANKVLKRCLKEKNCYSYLNIGGKLNLKNSWKIPKFATQFNVEFYFQIGMMRCGQLLIESEPNQILAEFQSESLEQVFLTLSQKQADNQARGITEVVNETPPGIAEVTASSTSLNNGPYSSTDVRNLIIIIFRVSYFPFSFSFNQWFDKIFLFFLFS